MKFTALALLSLVACTRVGPGHVAIEVNMAGDDRGVDQIPLQTGWVFFNPVSTNIYTYPTFVQTARWEGEETATFNSLEGLPISGDVSLSYQIDPAKIPAFYVKFREDNIGEWTHGFMRNVARDAFNEIASTYPVEDIYGAKKEQFILAVRDRINKSTTPYGVTIEQFGFLEQLKLPPQVRDALTMKIAATQNAIRVENELRQAEAEAKKRVAAAQGEAESNTILTDSISDKLLKWRTLEITQKAIDKWDGRRPMVEGQGSGLLLQIPLPEQAR